MKLYCCIAFALLSTTLFAQTIPWRTATGGWKSDSLGNHRAVIQLSGSRLGHIIIPWRRNDTDPAKKKIIIEDARTHLPVAWVKAINVSNEQGEIWFDAPTPKGVYYAYYLPYRNEGRSNYPRGVYLTPDLSSANQPLPQDFGLNGTVTAFESIDTFNSFYPMEVIATQKETEAIIAASKRKDYLVFPEDRRFPVRMQNRLPQRWVNKAYSGSFTGTASRNENYLFQLAVFALQDIQDIKISFSDFVTAAGNTIPAKDLFCLNTNGIDYTGKAFTKTVNVSKGDVQPLWCGLQVPKSAAAGTYSGTVRISTANASATLLTVQLKVGKNMVEDAGISAPDLMTRLPWLNSTMAQENTVIAPYTALKRENQVIRLLGREIEMGEEGFPKQIRTFFNDEMTGYTKEPNALLYEPIHFHFTGSNGKNAVLKHGDVHYLQEDAGSFRWEARNGNDSLEMNVTGSLEFDGFGSYTVQVIAKTDLHFKDIVMHIPFKKEMTDYLMGLGQKGGKRPELVDWKWDVAHKNQDGVWIGNVNAGLQYSLRDEKYVRPLNTNFYLQKPLLLPTSWGNAGKGGIQVGIKGSSMLANNYTGERDLKKGDTLYFNFTLLITPFHTINTDFQWNTRFYHKYDNLDTIKATGASVVNIHHATPINPWINYPFIEHKKMKDYIDQAHKKGLKVKIYNTVRELSNHAHETFALRSLGHEIYSTGTGGGFSWLQEHVNTDYIAAWFVPEIKDAALINSGMSRWHNYYVEGMNWLTRNIGIDGIYLDDVAFDRITMKRIKRVLTADGHPGIIDLHSANQFNKNDGFNNSANLYMEHFPYLNRLWFGEYFDYENNNPDFFLTEVSGIPFGLMGEMLEKGGNAWRGMVYGMTNRMPWSDGADPRPLWKIWDAFGMKRSKMIGYWSRNCPVTTNNPNVIATAYTQPKKAMIALASWASADTTVQLNINWTALGINPAKAVIHAPFIDRFQPEAHFKPDELIPVPKNKGWLLILEER
jgi:hypothetical protein